MEEKNYTEAEKQLVEEVIKAVEKIRPYVQHDGGDLEFTYLEEKKAHIRFLGACAGCMLAQVDFSEGIESFILDEVPDLEAVILDEPEPTNNYWF